MITNIIHSIVVCLAAFTLLFIVACSGQEDSLPDNIGEAALYLNIEPIGRTRAGVAELPNNEKISSVRVIVLHENGTVEHNRFYPLEGAQERKSIILKVTPNEKKKIFLFANEESVSVVEGVTPENQSLTDFFNCYAKNATDFAEAVDSLYFAPDYTGEKPIPMSSMYEIDFPEKENYNGTFYLVRIATKFTINFKNWRKNEVVKVDSFSIASYADKNFLMAHINDSEQNGLLFNGKTWIDWLKEVSEASSENNDYATTDAAGWLKDYKLPAQAVTTNTYTHGPVIVGAPDIDTETPDNITPGLVVGGVPVFYLPESKNPKAGAIDGTQEYTMTIHIEGREEPFICPLPNLKALFRNTHVVVNVSFKKQVEIELYAGIKYWELINPVNGEVEEEK